MHIAPSEPGRKHASPGGTRCFRLRRQLPEVQSVLRTPNGNGYEAWAEEIVKPAAKWAGDRVDYSDVDLTAA